MLVVWSNQSVLDGPIAESMRILEPVVPWSRSHGNHVIEMNCSTPEFSFAHPGGEQRADNR